VGFVVHGKASLLLLRPSTYKQLTSTYCGCIQACFYGVLVLGGVSISDAFYEAFRSLRYLCRYSYHHDNLEVLNISGGAFQNLSGASPFTTLFIIYLIHNDTSIRPICMGLILADVDVVCDDNDDDDDDDDDDDGGDDDDEDDDDW